MPGRRRRHHAPECGASGADGVPEATDVVIVGAGEAATHAYVQHQLACKHKFPYERDQHGTYTIDGLLQV